MSVIDPTRPIIRKELNETLRILQEKGAKILDIKLSTCNGSGLFVTYLISYEAPTSINVKPVPRFPRKK
jgi:hypothetical protein